MQPGCSHQPSQVHKFQVPFWPQAGNEASSSASLQMCISTHHGQIESEAGKGETLDLLLSNQTFPL